MSAEYMHIGIPVTNRKPGMLHNEGAKFWYSNVDDYDYKIEYLKFEEGTPFPEEIHRNPHVAYKVDDLEKYIADADSVICGPMEANEKGDRLAFVGDTIFRASYGATHFPGGDEPTLMESIKTRLLTLPTDTLLLSGHSEPTTVGEEQTRPWYQ